MSLGISVNKGKNGILLAYIASNIHDIHLRKLLKIIYLIDEHFMNMRGFPLTWFDYYAWSKGPVSPEVYNIKNGAFKEFVISYRSEANKQIVESVSADDEIKSSIKKMFSNLEIREIDNLISLYGKMTADELSDITHVADSVWSKTVADNHLQFDEIHTKSVCLIDLKMFFETNDWRKAVYEDARWNMELQAKINSNKNPNNRIQLQVVSPSEREQYCIPVYSPAIP